MSRPTPRSYWLQEALGDAPPSPALQGRQRCDVAIVGGGYVGLWTALRLKELEPSCDVAVVERDVCGAGASGRNGGFVLSWWPKIASLVELCGSQEALRLAQASERAIDEVGAFCQQHAPDAEFRRGGWLWTATAPAHLNAWAGVLRACDRLGHAPFQPLDPVEVAARTGSPVHLAGVLEPSAATVQPAVLVRALRRVALQRGVRIFERSRVRRLVRRRPVRLLTARGALDADAAVIATNGWAAAIPELHTAMVVVSSDIVLTEPIPDRLAAIGWTGGEGITDSQTMVDYYRTTADGRIAFGKGGWGLAFGGWMPPSMHRDPRRARLVAADFRRYYPMLRDVAISHDWAGPIDRTPHGLPIFGRLGGHPSVVYGVGWSGNGVGPSVLGGRILASLALGRDDAWTASPLVRRRRGHFPPEPIRYLGALAVRRAVIRKEAAEALGRPPSRVAVALAKLAPAGLEDKQ